MGKWLNKKNITEVVQPGAESSSSMDEDVHKKVVKT